MIFLGRIGLLTRIQLPYVNVSGRPVTQISSGSSGVVEAGGLVFTVFNVGYVKIGNRTDFGMCNRIGWFLNTTSLLEGKIFLGRHLGDGITFFGGLDPFPLLLFK